MRNHEEKLGEPSETRESSLVDIESPKRQNASISYTGAAAITNVIAEGNTRRGD